jgi:hypothetical protein
MLSMLCLLGDEARAYASSSPNEGSAHLIHWAIWYWAINEAVNLGYSLLFTCHRPACKKNQSITKPWLTHLLKQEIDWFEQMLSQNFFASSDNNDNILLVSDRAYNLIWPPSARLGC